MRRVQALAARPVDVVLEFDDKLRHTKLLVLVRPGAVRFLGRGAGEFCAPRTGRTVFVVSPCGGSAWVTCKGRR
ncbi:hypothetical protein GCM10023335_65680 [Streptomyces siamensis]|uniref:Uncharacterized protein n=1 Tax=Streptomyces siamensis TaxID=1274986 RepID=A0ABP9JEH8_9ACTN